MYKETIFVKYSKYARQAILNSVEKERYRMLETLMSPSALSIWGNLVLTRYVGWPIIQHLMKHLILRNGEEQDRHLLQEAVNVFVEMGYNFGGNKLKGSRGTLVSSLSCKTVMFLSEFCSLLQTFLPNFL